MSIVIEWYNWTMVHRNWKEGHEIQTDAEKGLSKGGLESSGPSPMLGPTPSSTDRKQAPGQKA